MPTVDPRVDAPNSIVVCPVCFDAYADDRTANPVAKAFVEQHGPDNCKGKPCLTLDESRQAIILLASMGNVLPN